MYKTFSTDTRPMPLRVPSTVFADEWKRCWYDHTRPPVYLQNMVSPFLDRWEHQLTTPGSQKDLNYVIFARLVASAGDPVELISNWVEHEREQGDVRKELECLFWEQLRTFHYHPRTRPRKLEFILAYDYRRRLKQRVLRFNNRPLDIPASAPTFSALVHEDTHPDYLLLENLELTPWEEYLLQLYRLGAASAYEVSATTHIPRETLYYEERDLWHRLRQTFSPPEP